MLFSHYFYLAKPKLSPHSPPSVPGTHHPASCVCGANCSRGLVSVDSNIIYSSVSGLSLSIMPSGFTHTVTCVRNAFLSGWTTFIVWMNHGLLVHSSVEGHMEYLHSSLTSCNICGITSKSPMIQKSFTINYFINFFTLKTTKGQKKGRMHVSFTCV